MPESGSTEVADDQGPPDDQTRPAEAERLETGWLATTPQGDNLLRDAVDSIAERVRFMADSMGHRYVASSRAVFADHGSPSIFANKAMLLCAPGEPELTEIVGEARSFMRAGSANPFLLWSALPTPDLSGAGFALVGHPPIMYRPSGPAASPTPEGLEIVGVADADQLAEFERIFIEGFPIADLLPWRRGCFVDERVLGGPIHFFIGYLDGAPVASGGVCVASGLNMVEFIATLPEARGRGIGEAMTWAGTCYEPDLPAALVASDLGRPVYERMGFVSLARCTLWVGR